MDVKIKLIYSDLEEEIYMSQLDNFMVKGKENMVFRLKGYLYCLNSHLGFGTKNLILG
jgi:hypothetical protein